MDGEQGRRSEPSPHLFTVRFWPERLGDGRFEWRGKVQDTGSGEAYYFRDFEMLIGRMEALLASAEGGAGAADPRVANVDGGFDHEESD